jgi:hypothetical protein
MGKGGKKGRVKDGKGEGLIVGKRGGSRMGKTP